MGELYKKLEAYDEQGIYPFHMPGHKRNRDYFRWNFPFFEDITEIEGFDNLHHATGLIKKAQEELADLYGAKKSYFMVNGSTGGILSAISASVPKKGQIIIARNCHKSVYHALYLRELEPIYIMPRVDKALGLNGDVTPDQVEEAFFHGENVKAVLLTSPTYEGVVSDIESIAQVCHENKAVLIVDEAHGAHMKFSSFFPTPAEELGADLVVQSFHKTLPALTQTAVIHVCSDRISQEKLERFLSIYQTSSPSYLFMASLDRCVEYMQEKGRQDMEKYISVLKDFDSKAGENRNFIRYIPQGVFALDRSRLILTSWCRDLEGGHLARSFRERYGLEMEMSCPEYTIALTGIGDRKEGFDRLLGALRDLEKEYPFCEKRGRDRRWEEPSFIPIRKMGLYEALERETRTLPLLKAEGLISAEFIYLYPPGIPFLAPGELVDGKLLHRLLELQAEGYPLQGMADTNGRMLRVVGT